jgi:hypothetical protein
VVLVRLRAFAAHLIETTCYAGAVQWLAPNPGQGTLGDSRRPSPMSSA